MNKHILNRAILNRDALDDNQRKAMFARLGGHGGGTAYGGSASKAHDAAFKDKMAKAWAMGFGLGKDMVGGIAVAEASGVQAAAAASRSPLLAKFRDALRQIADEAADFQPTQKVGTQARRNELAAALRRDRELKRMDLHPEQFRTTQPFMSATERQLRSAAARNPSAPAAEFGYMGGGTIGERVARIDREAKAYSAAKATARGHRPGETLALYGNRMPPARSDEERRRRAFFASKGDGMAARARSLLDTARTRASNALAAAREHVVVGPADVNPPPRNGFLDWALREQRPGGPVIQDNPRNPYDTPEQWAQNLRAQYEEWLQQNPVTTLPVSRPVEIPVTGSRQTVQEIPVPSPQLPRQRPTPPGGPGMPIGGPAPVYGEPGTRPIPRNPPDPTRRIGGPAPVRRYDTPASTPKVTASTLQRAVDQFRTW